MAKSKQQGGLPSDENVIAVIGPTGAGKSNIVRLATKQPTKLGHLLNPFTRKTQGYAAVHPDNPNCKLVFVDTPGIDDASSSTDLVKILNGVHGWLKSKYGDEKLAGIIYCHRISDNRYTPQAFTSLNVFQQLCKSGTLKSVILVTTMWDTVSPAIAEKRQKDLEDKFWKIMIAAGSSTVRFSGDTNIWQIVDKIIIPSK